MKAIEVHEGSSEEEKVIFGMLATAKHIHEDPDKHPGGAQPMAFVFGADKGLAIVGLGRCGDWNDGSVRLSAADLVRRVAKDRRASIVAVVSDSWITRFPDGVGDAAIAAGLDPSDYKRWSPEDVKRFPFSRREALSMIIETREGSKVMYQFYRRERAGKLRWMEVEIEAETEDAKASGIFSHMLPPPDDGQKVEADEALPRLAIFDQGTMDDAIASFALGVGKRIVKHPEIANGAGTPFACLFMKEDLEVVRLRKYGDWNDPHSRELCVAVLREAAKDRGALFVMTVASSRQVVVNDLAAARAAGLSPDDWRSWSAELQEKHVEHRNALTLFMEGHTGFRVVTQFYEGEGDQIVWGETLVRSEDHTNFGAGIASLLPPESRQQ